ncbi:MAG: sodium/proline symporter [Parachlamydiaceae bacterium]
MHNQIVFAFFLYFLILLAIGLFSHKKQTSSADFIVGNRSLNFWLTALSAHASDMSAWLFMAFPAALFIKGLPGFWIALGLILGMFLNWQFIAEKLRRETEKYNSFTLSTFFERRFMDNTGVLRVLTALMSLVYLTIYLGSGLYAMGLLFNSIFGIDYYLGISIATFVVLTYVFFGGFITVAWTDFVQGMFLLFVIALVAILSYLHLPEGWNSIKIIADTRSISLDWIDSASMYGFMGIIFSILMFGLGYFGQPHIITKFMGIKSPSEMTKAKYLGMTWQILSLSAAGLIGLVGLAFFPDGLQKPELVFVEIVKVLFHPFLVGFFLCGMIAANMSTMDSQILVCASVLSEDFYKHIFKKNASPLELLRASRASVLLISLCAFLIASFTNSTISSMVLYAWSGLGSSFGPLVITSLYDSKANRQGAIAGILVGGLVSGFWPIMNPYLSSITIPNIIPAFFAGLFSIYIVSRMTRSSAL